MLRVYVCIFLVSHFIGEVFVHWMTQQLPQKETRSLVDMGHLVSDKFSLRDRFSRLDQVCDSLPYVLVVAALCCDLQSVVYRSCMVCVLRTISYCSAILPSIQRTKAPLSPMLFLTGGMCDLMFSGHTAYSIIALFSLYKYLPAFIFTPLFFVWMLIVPLYLCVSFRHYTVDMWISVIITYLLCKS